MIISHWIWDMVYMKEGFLCFSFFCLFFLTFERFSDEEKKMNATYIISIARKLGCSIFLLPEDITEVSLWSSTSFFPLHCFLNRSMVNVKTNESLRSLNMEADFPFSFYLSQQVNQKMILTLTASIMYWFMKQPVEEKPFSDSENGSQAETISNSTIDDSASESSIEDNGNI